MERSDEKFGVRIMTRAEVETAIEWAAAEGWNPGIHDAACFFASDPGGFLIGELDGQVAGTVSAVSYGSSYGFIGLFIVKPEFRGKGIGRRLGKAAMERLGGRTIGVDGVLAEEENYRRHGFRIAYRNVRYQCVCPAARLGNAVALKHIPWEELVRYDEAVFSAPRPRFLRKWIDQPEGAAYGYLDRGKLSGYGVIRKCRTGFKIGPLFADDARIAEELFCSLSESAAGDAVFLDVPEVNRGGTDLAKRYGMKMVFQTVRMYLGVPPPVPVEKVFGVTSFELG